MPLFSQLRELVGRARGKPTTAASDAPSDTTMVRSRPTGGVSDRAAPDTHSTTGTTPSETFVGRAAGDDPGDAEKSGAELRAEHEDPAGSDDDPKR